MSFVTTVFLPLFAFNLACSFTAEDGQYTNSVIGGVTVMLYSYIILSMLELSRHLQDVYGSNLEDLNILQFVESSIHAG